MIALIDGAGRKEIKRERSRIWYQNNKARREAYVRKFQRERKLWAIEYKGSACQDCGEDYPPAVYDFHHLGGKDMNPSVALRGSLEKAKRELDKCVLLCANCHRIRHFV